MSSEFAIAHANGVPRIFDSFRRWPLVPSSELLQLRTALLQCMELAAPESGRELSDSARRLLGLVTDELERRNQLAEPGRLRRFRSESRTRRSTGPLAHRSH